MGKFTKSLIELLKLPFAILSVLFGLSMLFSGPVPGLDDNTRIWVGLFLIGLGATIWKILGMRYRETVRARAWRDVLRE